MAKYIIITEVVYLIGGTSGANTQESHAGNWRRKELGKTDLKLTMKSGFCVVRVAAC